MIQENCAGFGRSEIPTWRFRVRPAILLAFSAALPANSKGLVVGQPAPPITLHTLDGRDIDTRDLRGKVVIVTFRATCADRATGTTAAFAICDRACERWSRRLGFSLDTPDDLDEVRPVSRQLNFPVGLAVIRTFPGTDASGTCR